MGQIVACLERCWAWKHQRMKLFYQNNFILWGAIFYACNTLCVIFRTVVLIFIIVSYYTTFWPLYRPAFLKYLCFTRVWKWFNLGKHFESLIGNERHPRNMKILFRIIPISWTHYLIKFKCLLITHFGCFIKNYILPILLSSVPSSNVAFPNL